MPTSASGSSIANSNGKRPIQTINGNEDDMEELPNGGRPRQDLQPKTHATGYQWAKTEDEPGFAWLNKKAIDEYNRAIESVVHQDSWVRNRYGDPLETGEKEQGILNSTAAAAQQQ